MDIFQVICAHDHTVVPKDPSRAQIMEFWRQLTEECVEVRRAIRKSGVGVEFGYAMVREVNAVAEIMVQNGGTYNGTWEEDAPTLAAKGIAASTVTGNTKLKAAVAKVMAGVQPPGP